MTADTDLFAEFVRLAGLNPSVVLEIEIKLVADAEKFGPGILLRVGEPVMIPGRGVATFYGFRSGCEPILDVPSGYVQCGTRSVPEFEPDLAPVPDTPAEYWQRKALLAHRIASADGRLQVSGGTECGWLPIVERAVEAILGVMAQTDVVDIAAWEECGWLHTHLRAYGDGTERCHFIRCIGDRTATVDVWMVMSDGAVRGIVTTEGNEYMLRFAFDQRLDVGEAKSFASLDEAARRLAQLLDVRDDGAAVEGAK